ncbi:unnamed protein product [Urochloa decumbens]|uniref:DUF1618 domain-containing protein n=1 Tax=Urochloa decumbens TaxID=240449 RepID=A0ABC9GZX3_9POAL
MTTLPNLCSAPPVVGHGSGALFHPRLGVIPDGDIPQSWASASATTSDGNEVRISVRLASPPATSFVKVQSAAAGDKLKPRLRLDPTSRVVAAHGDLLLICMPLVDDDSPSYSRRHQHDLFVFRACVGHPCWLRRVPHASYYYCRINNPLGIVSLPGGGGHFILADLQMYSSRYQLDPATGHLQEIACLVRYFSATDRWDFKAPLAMPYDGDALKPDHWRTDMCFCSSTDDKQTDNGSTAIMYWVDYHLGLLRCDVGNCAPMLRFIRLPEIESWNSYSFPAYMFLQGRMRPEAYRTASAYKGGTVIFVHVDNGLFGLHKKSGFTITIWALKMPEFEWHEVRVLQVDDELWQLPTFKDSPLPRWVPQFPMVSMRQEGVLHFILHEYPCGDDDWMITVDMHQKLLQSYENRIEAGW